MYKYTDYSFLLNFIKTDNTSDTTGLIAIIIAVIGALGLIVAAFITGWLPVFMYQKKGGKSSKVPKKQIQTIQDRLYIYRRMIQADPRISTLQILDMSRPLRVANVYVRLRLHQQTASSYKINDDLLKAESSNDPNAMLNAEKIYLEKRIYIALDPEIAIPEYRRCIIVGDPGAGKTTLLKYLALKAVSGQSTKPPFLPIHIELNAFASSTQNDLLMFAASTWQDRYNISKSSAISCIKKSLEEGNAILLLDALDETVIGDTLQEAEERYRLIANIIMDISTRYYKSIVVVTARKAGYHQRATRLQGFNELEVLDFRPEDIKRFIYQWFSEIPTRSRHINADDLILKLERNSRLLALAANPLLLSLITIVYEAELDLPDRRTELYKQCIDILLAKWDASRDIIRRREFKPEHKRQLLQEVAWYFHQKGERYFSDQELLAVIANFLPTIGLSREQNKDILTEIAAENGLLKEQAQGWHGFMHLTLQEYFAAQYVSINNLIDQIFVHRHEPWWEEIVLLYAGLTPDASVLIKKLLEGDSRLPLEMDYRVSLVGCDLILAARSLEARPTIKQVCLRQEVISRLFNVLMKTQRSDLRQVVATSLVDVGGDEINGNISALLFSQRTPLAVNQCLVFAIIRQRKYFAIRVLLKLLIDSHTDISLKATIWQNLPSWDVNGVSSVLSKAERQTLIPSTISQIQKSASASLLSRWRQEKSLDPLIYFLSQLR
jgi:energy-coupling factor transporter ATP-binding protein EcfA2